MSALAAATTAVLLADPTDVGDETHKAGPLAILVIAVLCVGAFLLFRSMSVHLRRVREQFPGEDDGRDGARDDDAVRAAPTDPAAGGVSAPADATASSSPATGGARPTPKSRARVDDQR